MNELETLEVRVGALAGAGRCAPLGGKARLEAARGPLRARALTLPAYGGVNTDNVLLAATAVGAAPAIAIAIAHGNYKDEGCAIASAALVAECAGALGEPLLADADAAPALRRALIAGDERIERLASQPLKGRRFASTSAGVRKSLRGIGASALAALVTGEALWLAHLGENEAFLLRGGRARRLVQAHTLANLAEYRRAPSERVEFADQIVLRVLGFGDANAVVTRAKLEPGDRLVFGNAGLSTLAGAGEAPALARPGLDELASELEAGLVEKAHWAPATFALIDVGR